jgi:hypothetical protein
MLAHGLEGIEKVDSIFGEHFDEVDIFVFTDIYFSDEQTYLESIGKRVWGSRRGEELELYREVCKAAMAEAGLPVAPWRKVKGIPALREHLKANGDQHVKIDRWRGMFETFHAATYELVEGKLNELQHDMGPFADSWEFIVEDDLPDRVEAGIDSYCIDGEFPSHSLIGIEVKDLGYVGKFVPWAEIPEPLRRWNERMSPVLREYGYRGFLSTEVRIGKDKVPHMIDCCARAGSPPNELYQNFYANLAEIVWDGADGQMVNPESVGKWGVEVIVESDFAEEHWLPVDVPDEIRANVKLFNAVKVDGRYWIAPQDEKMSQIGAIVGYGDTLEAAMQMVDKVAEKLSAFRLKVPRGSLEQAQKQFEELEKMLEV